MGEQAGGRLEIQEATGRGHPIIPNLCMLSAICRYMSLNSCVPQLGAAQPEASQHSAPVAIVHAIRIRLQLHHAALVSAATAAAALGGTPLGSRRAASLLGLRRRQLQVKRLALVVFPVAHVAQHCKEVGRAA